MDTNLERVILTHVCFVGAKIVCHDSPTVNDLTSVGLVAVNKGFLDVGVQFLQVAKARAAASQQARLSSLLATAVRVVTHQQLYNLMLMNDTYCEF